MNRTVRVNENEKEHGDGIGKRKKKNKEEAKGERERGESEQLVTRVKNALKDSFFGTHIHLRTQQEVIYIFGIESE